MPAEVVTIRKAEIVEKALMEKFTEVTDVLDGMRIIDTGSVLMSALSHVVSQLPPEERLATVIAMHNSWGEEIQEASQEVALLNSSDKNPH